MHAVMAVRAKEFEAQLQPADMPPHLLRQRECGIEVRGVDGQIKRRGHGLSAGKRSLGAGGMSFTGAAAGVGAGAGVTGRFASARRSAACRSLARSAERRVGKGGVSPFRSWWSPYH